MDAVDTGRLRELIDAEDRAAEGAGTASTRGGAAVAFGVSAEVGYGGSWCGASTRDSPVRVRP
jgi:hypothetical protein